MSHKGFSKNVAGTGSTGKQPSLRALALSIAVISMLAVGLTFRAASRDLGDRKIIATFNGPVEIPGKALPAGTYVFKVLNTNGGRDIVQVFDKDEKQLLGTMLAVPDYRDPPPDKPVVNFEERRSDAPQAVKALYFPGDTYGLEFVYPQERAIQLAKRTNQNVLSMSNNMRQNMANPARSANAPSVQQLENTDVTGVNGSGAPVAIVIIVGTKPER